MPVMWLNQAPTLGRRVFIIDRHNYLTCAFGPLAAAALRYLELNTKSCLEAPKRKRFEDRGAVLMGIIHEEHYAHVSGLLIDLF